LAKYKKTTSNQGKLLPVYLSKQLLPGTFEFTLNHLIDNELDLAVFLGLVEGFPGHRIGG